VGNDRFQRLTDHAAREIFEAGVAHKKNCNDVEGENAECGKKKGAPR